MTVKALCLSTTFHHSTYVMTNSLVCKEMSAGDVTEASQTHNEHGEGEVGLIIHSFPPSSRVWEKAANIKVHNN